MRVLVTCDRRLSSEHEGLILRIHHYVRLLRERHLFDLVCLNRGDGSSALSRTESLFHDVDIVPYEAGESVGWTRRLISAFDPDELYPRSERAMAAIESRLAAQAYDLIWDAGANMMANLVATRRRVPVLADQVDDVFLMLSRQLEMPMPLRRRVWLYKHYWMQLRFARRHLEPSAGVLFVSSLDEQSFKRRCPNARTITITNGVDEEYFCPAGKVSSKSEPVIVFEGVMQFGPNVDAAVHLVNDIMPLLRARLPGVRVMLVGRNPAPQVQALACEDVEVTGYVDDVRPYLSTAAVFVCPMRMGAGIKNKILQAWSMGMAVVSTPEGCAGLDAIDGHNILIRSGDVSFATAVAELMSEPERRERLGAAARQTILDQYSWAAKASAMARLFEAVGR